jgi:hypothetical protein
VAGQRRRLAAGWAIIAMIWGSDMPRLGEDCIWCKGSTEKSDLSHVVPMYLGNTEQVLVKGVVCSSCNRSFSRKIEPALLKDPVIQTMCAMYHVVNARTGKVIQPRLFGRHSIPIDLPHLTPQLHLAVRQQTPDRPSTFELTVVCQEAGIRDAHFQEEYKQRDVALFSRAVHKVVFESFVHDQMTSDIKLPGLDVFDQSFTPIRQWARYGDPQKTVRPLARMVATPIERTWQLRGRHVDQHLILEFRYLADVFIISATSPHDQVQEHLRQWYSRDAAQICLIADDYGPLIAGQSSPT